MTAVFIFADQIRAALAAGKKEIEVPKGARISAAAHDLIRDHKLRLIHARESQAAPEEASEASLPDDRKTVAKAAGSQSEENQPAPESDGSNSPADETTEIPNAVLEEIVDRVIAKFKRIKGLEPATPAPGAATAAPAGAAVTDDDDMVICRCEEITKGEIKEAIRNGMRTLNGIKRVTRAGMGLCQGQTCQRLVAQIVSEELGLSAAEIDPTTARGPVRPLRLKVFANR